MIGRLPLPPEYVAWNEHWGAPYGRPAVHAVPLGQRFARPDPSYGPFAFQMTNGTRAFEFPWAYFAAAAGPGARVLEVGGGISGLQFVLAMDGADVVLVDPNAEGSGAWPPSMPFWPVGADLHDGINKAFGTRVRMVDKTLAEADLADASFDRVLCLSILEHLTPAAGRDLLERMTDRLAPGGLLVLTVDLFLDLRPFGVLARNGYGTNVDLHQLTDGLGLDLVHGDRRELFGFPEFDRDRVVGELAGLHMSPNYPSVSQALALRKPPAGTSAEEE